MITIRKRKLSDGTYSLYLDIYDKGKRRREALPGLILNGSSKDKETMRMAETIKGHMMTELAKSNYDFLFVFGQDKNFGEYFEEVAKRKNFVKNLSVRKIIEAYSPGTKFKDINIIWAEKLMAFMRKPQLKKSDNKLHPYSETTIATTMTEIKMTLNEAVREGLIHKNPLTGLRIKRPVPLKVFLTPDEINTLYNVNCPNDEVKRAFIFACYTGLRLSDIEKLKYSDIENGHVGMKQTKTGQVVRIPLNETALQVLRTDVLNLNSQVFKMPARSSLHYNLREWIAAAGITKKVTFHSSRHTFATMLITYGADIYTVSKLLGHTDVKVTQIYAKLVDEKKTMAVNLLPKIG